MAVLTSSLTTYDAAGCGWPSSVEMGTVNSHPKYLISKAHPIPPLKDLLYCKTPPSHWDSWYSAVQYWPSASGLFVNFEYHFRSLKQPWHPAGGLTRDLFQRYDLKYLRAPRKLLKLFKRFSPNCFLSFRHTAKACGNFTLRCSKLTKTVPFSSTKPYQSNQINHPI